MKFFFTKRGSLSILCFLLSCAPKNPYYGNNVMKPPREQYLQHLASKQAFKVVDDSYPGYLLAHVPTSIADSNSTGECVLEIIIDENMQIKEISIVGLYIGNREQNYLFGFDRYHGAKKRVVKTPEKISKFLPFLKEYILNQKIEHVEDIKKAKINKVGCLVYLNRVHSD